MKIAVIGAGAMGSFLAARLASAGEDVTVVDRGETLAAIKTNGLTLIETDGTRVSVEVRTAPQVADIGEQEVIILAVKAHQLAAVVTKLPGDDCMVVTPQNGIPWWYFFKHGGSHEGRRLESVDRGGVIADHLPIDRVVGCVLYPAAEMVSPGVVKHAEGKRISVSEIDGVRTERIQRLSAALRRAGLKAPIVSNIRAEIWTKLWGNLSFNPISALTHATLEEISRDPLSRQLVLDAMDEAQRVAEAVGITIPISKEQRIAATEAIGAHKTSMLQDIERGKSVEADALVGAVSEIGRLVNVPTPRADALYALVKLLASTLERRGGRLAVQQLNSCCR